MPTIRMSMQNAWAAAFALPWCLWLAGCGAEDPASEQGETRVAELAEPVLQLDEVAAALLDGTADSLTFQADERLGDIVAGDVVVSADPAAPYLRRVTERVDDADGNITLRTEDVAIDALFVEADVSAYAEFLEFVPADGVEVNSESRSSKSLGGPQGKTVPVANLDLTFKLTNHEREGSTNVKLDLSALLEIERPRLFSVQRVKASVIADYEFAVGLSVKLAEFIDPNEWKFPIGTYRAIFWMGVVPVYTEIDLVIELSGDVKAAVAIAAKGHVESGGEWKSGEGWRRVHVHDPLAYEGKVQGEVSLNVAAVAYFRFYKVVGGPKMAFGPAFTASVSSLDPCTVEWDLALKGEAVIELGKIVGDEELDDMSFGFEYKDPLTKGKFKLCEADKPKAPTNFSARRVGDEDRVALAWKDNADNEAGYLVQWNAGGTWRDIMYVAANGVAYVHEGPTLGIENQYRVCAVGQAGTLSDPSDVASVMLEEKSPPAAPTGLSARAEGDRQITLAWTDASIGEKGFLIERAVGEGGFEPYSSVDAGVPGYIDRFVQRDQAYVYRVRAYGAGGLSEYSNEAPARTSFFDVIPSIPVAASSLRASAVTSSEIALQWGDNSSVETGYVVERSNEDGTWSMLVELSADTTSYTDTGLSADTAYSYRVRARNSQGDSANSNPATARTLADGNKPNPDDNSMSENCAATAIVSISHLAFDANVTVGQSKTFSASATGAVGAVEFFWSALGGVNLSPDGVSVTVTGSAAGSVTLTAEARDATYGCVLGAGSIVIAVTPVDNYRVYRVPAICEHGQLEVFNDQAYAAGIPMCSLGGGGLDCTVMVVAESMTEAFPSPEEAVQALCPRITGYIHGYWWDYVGVDGVDYCFGSLSGYDAFWDCAPD